MLGTESMTGSAGQQRVSIDFVRNFVIPIPPKNQQDEILKCVYSIFAAYRTIINRAQREIDLIREYRTRLIADVVTGKVDVRKVEVRREKEEEREKAKGRSEKEEEELEEMLEEAEGLLEEER